MKTSELTGFALDWAVAKCEGAGTPYIGKDGKHHLATANYSTDWSQGGLIIERENISIVREGDAGNWVASVYNYAEADWHLHTEGTTPLEAAMRCYVASKLGDEVEIPKELTQGEIK
jgi:hypothetical protein